MNRRGRKRHQVKRHPNGSVPRARGESPREVAARMPHRRPFGEAALDYRAESELGRLALAGAITAEQFVAGSTFRRVWGAYLSTLGPPRAIGVPAGSENQCEGCPATTEPEKCACARRRAFYQHAERALRRRGRLPELLVRLVVLQDGHSPLEWLGLLRMGLDALASHFGLTKPGKVCINSSSTDSRPPGSSARALLYVRP